VRLPVDGCTIYDTGTMSKPSWTAKLPNPPHGAAKWSNGMQDWGRTRTWGYDMLQSDNSIMTNRIKREIRISSDRAYAHCVAHIWEWWRSCGCKECLRLFLFAHREKGRVGRWAIGTRENGQGRGAGLRCARAMPSSTSHPQPDMSPHNNHTGICMNDSCVDVFFY
jgi:hypothetical protein